MILFENVNWIVCAYTWDSIGPFRASLRTLRGEAFQLSATSDSHILEDSTDQVCTHIIGIEKESETVFGAYRARLPCGYGSISEKLFSLDSNLSFVQHGIELGRAVIDPNFQKSYSALLLLWRGIQAFCNLHPACTHVYGPVTIDKNFPLPALGIMRRYFNRVDSDRELDTIFPKFPLDASVDLENVQQQPHEDISTLDKELRKHHQTRLPVLIRHYASFGCVFSRFGRWPEFDNAFVTLAALEIKHAKIDLLR